MIKALKIGPHQFKHNLIQGPLAGYTCAPMRVQTSRFTQPAYCSTEMVSANHLVHAKKTPKRYLDRDPNEGALCFQLSADDPEILGFAVQRIQSIEPEIIELNCGCPVKKIRRKGAGSKLLTDPDQLRRLIQALRKNSTSAISIKIRVAGEDQEQNDFEIAEMAEQEGVDALIVHGRHWTEKYDQPCRLAQIKRLVDAVKIPVIGNGDVKDFDSLKSMLEQTGCAGVMIGRASMGQPWLFEELLASYHKQPFTKPNSKEIAEIFIDHVDRLAKLDSEHHAVLQARKMGKYYARQVISSPQEFVLELMKCKTLDQFHSVVGKFF